MHDDLGTFLTRHTDVIRVRITDVRGSAPRDVGTDMFVAAAAQYGTIGGGQLEYMALDTARAMLTSGRNTGEMNVPLGPEIGQCCGGRVEIKLDMLDADLRSQTLTQNDITRAAYPEVYIFGAGHVGRALAGFFALLPVQTILLDSRQDELALCNAPVDRRLTALPEADIRRASAGAAFIILTHDHALDFLLTAEALARPDAAYIGMIGSHTKRKKFERFCATQAPATATDRLICPIGATVSTDKRPAIIAAFVAAEVMTQLTKTPSQQRTLTT